MGLFRKHVGDQEWKTAVSAAADVIRDVCEVFETTGPAVGSDPVLGWAGVADLLAALDVLEARFKKARRTCDAAGTPKGEDRIIASTRQSLDTFFSAGRLAFHWGKHHYRDASGAPGERARNESGLAQRAAVVRVTNNGRQYVENALLAARAGRAALELLSDARQILPGPSLTEIFVSAVPGVKRLLREKSLRLKDVAAIGSWCFSRAAILGMVVSLDHGEFISMVWDPSKVERLWQRVDEEVARISEGQLPEDAGLGYIRLTTGYSELYGPDTLMAALDGGVRRGLEKLADSKVSAADAQTRWSVDTAIGLGLGITRPDVVRSRLEVEAEPDREAWSEAYQAGLDIPADPDVPSAEEQIRTVVDLCLAFFTEYYPSAKTKLEELTTRVDESFQ